MCVGAKILLFSFSWDNFDNLCFVNNYHAIRNEVTIISGDILFCLNNVMTHSNNNERTERKRIIKIFPNKFSQNKN